MQKVARFRKPNSNGVTEYNNREAKLQFLFGMYDLDVDKRISRSELLSVLQMMVGASVTMEQVINLISSMLLIVMQNFLYLYAF